MINYIIKENGYQIGVAQGTNKSIQYIKKLNLEGEWSQDNSGNILFMTTDKKVYSIEKKY